MVIPPIRCEYTYGHSPWGPNTDDGTISFVTVEWLFGDIINDFKFLDFKKNLII